MNSDERDEGQEPESAGIEIRVIGGGAPAGWHEVEPEEEVVRLEKKSLPQANKSVEDVGPAGPEPERRRRKRRGLRNRHLTLAMGGAVGVLVLLGVVVAVQQRNDGAPGEAVPFQNVGVEREGELTGLGQLSVNTQEYLGKAQDKLRRYLAAEDVSDVLPVIRDRGRWLAVLKQRWQPLHMADDEVDHLQMAFSEVGDRAWFSLNGQDDEGHDLRLIFVPNGSEVSMDWAASFGVGEVPFDELDHLQPAEPVAMRLMVKTDNYFTLDFPENEYRCFKLSSPFGQEWVWGYAEIGSEVALHLEDVLRASSMILEEKEDVGVILTLAKTPESGRRQLMIEELLAENWVEWEMD